MKEEPDAVEMMYPEVPRLSLKEPSLTAMAVPFLKAATISSMEPWVKQVLTAQ
jgi:hypothetical protein